jgi:hypothetical protein
MKRPSQLAPSHLFCATTSLLRPMLGESSKIGRSTGKQLKAALEAATPRPRQSPLSAIVSIF